MQYRRRAGPVVTAMQFTHEQSPFHVEKNAAGESFVRTHYGYHLVRLTDWVVVDAFGHAQVVDAETFKREYEPVPFGIN